MKKKRQKVVKQKEQKKNRKFLYMHRNMTSKTENKIKTLPEYSF